MTLTRDTLRELAQTLGNTTPPDGAEFAVLRRHSVPLHLEVPKIAQLSASLDLTAAPFRAGDLPDGVMALIFLRSGGIIIVGENSSAVLADRQAWDRLCGSVLSGRKGACVCVAQENAGP